MQKSLILNYVRGLSGVEYFEIMLNRITDFLQFSSLILEDKLIFFLYSYSGIRDPGGIFHERANVYGAGDSGSEPDSNVESVGEFEGTLTSGESSPEVKGGWVRTPVKDSLEIGTSLGACFIRTAAELDLQILTRDYQRQQCSLHTGTLDVQSFAGCVLATITVSASASSAPYLPLPVSTGKATTDFVSWAKKGHGQDRKSVV